MPALVYRIVPEFLLQQITDAQVGIAQQIMGGMQRGFQSLEAGRLQSVEVIAIRHIFVIGRIGCATFVEVLPECEHQAIAECGVVQSKKARVGLSPQNGSNPGICQCRARAGALLGKGKLIAQYLYRITMACTVAVI
mgnify:CR=1 FL=1